MKFIGITGGVGAGKSTILAYLRKNYRVRTLVADEVAHDIMEPGFDCYVRLQKEFAQEKIWLHNGRFNRQRLAEVIFADEEKRERLNSIVHPAVKEYILKEVEKERRSGSTDYVVLEAALLIEDGYGQICDELWYVYVTEENRRKRLIENRGYSDEKIEQMFAAQLSDGNYRRHCQVVIDNNGPIAQVYLQLAQLLNDKGDRSMKKALEREDTQKEELQYVFGLDIGTRNVVGTVGYKKDKEFIVVAQYAMEHETRAMLDGQIHDIGRVGRTISVIKEKLEDQIGQELTEVCIAAAGRVLKTVTTYVEHEFAEETVVTGEHIHTLDLLGVDKAAQELKEANDTKYKFYCVGYSVMKYYINDEIFSNLESHKADKISEKIIVTFLPEDVVDGLYMAVGFAGLTVANMTLEPIAAMDVAIPENFRMLNIALVDVGAGTSDISLTRDGSIIAYGMIPFAGDELTELIVQHYLVDFQMAEHIKLAAAEEDEIEFEDIMSLRHTIKPEEVWELTEPLVDKMTTEVADKIKELNGDQSVSATFIVGGGGKIHGFAEMLASKLELPQERVALRGEEVLKEVTFVQEEIEKDPLLVTPIGICLNYYEQKNNFIMVRFNGERLKLYDNNKLTIVDAAIQAGFPNDQLFPKRGREINFTVNGRPRIVRGDAGEAAIIRMNDRPASINTPIEPNCVITIEPSTAGREAHYLVGQLEEYHSSTISFIVNGKLITCPRYVEVNGILEPPTYEIKEHDAIVTRSFYTVEQLAEFMDVELDMDADILVNNRVEDLQALVYENFSVDWKVVSYRSTPQDVYPDAPAKNLQLPVKSASAAVVPVSGASRIPGKEETGMVRDAQTDAPEAKISQMTQTPALPGAEGIQTPALPGAEGIQKPVLPGAEGIQTPVLPGAEGIQTPADSFVPAPPAETALAADGGNVVPAAENAMPVHTAEIWESAAKSLENVLKTLPEADTVPSAAAGSTLPGAAVPAADAVLAGGLGAGAEASPTRTAGAGAEAAVTRTVGTGAEAAVARTAGAGAEAAVTGGIGAGANAVLAGGLGAGAEAAVTRTVGMGAEAAVTGGIGAGADAALAGGAGADAALAGGAGSDAALTGGIGARSDAALTGGLGAGANAVLAGGLGAGANNAALTGNMAAGADAAHTGAMVTAADGVLAKASAAAADRVLPDANPAGVSDVQAQAVQEPEAGCQVIINGETITLKNKKEYIFVDIFDYILFDLSQSRGRMLITQVNGETAQYTQQLHPGDKIDIYWKEN